jgi:hypothetical protein
MRDGHGVAIANQNVMDIASQNGPVTRQTRPIADQKPYPQGQTRPIADEMPEMAQIGTRPIADQNAGKT